MENIVQNMIVHWARTVFLLLNEGGFLFGQ